MNMKSSQALICLTLFGLLLSLVKGQVAVVDSAQTGTGQLSNAGAASTENEEVVDDENDVMSLLQNVTTVEEFMALLQINGRPLTREDVFTETTDGSGKQVIQGGGIMAVPDTCSPRETTVALELLSNQPDIVYFPKCTKVKRCGGCTSSPYLKCVPAYTERLRIEVFKAGIPETDTRHLDFTGTVPVIVEQHVTCRAECTLTARICGPRKNFLANRCSCKCKVDPVRCSPPHVWDPEECRCGCAERTACCHNEAVCGFVFDENTCQCVIDTRIQQISGNANISQADIDAYLESLGLDSPLGTTQPTTTTSTTTTTTATSTTTEESDPCDSVTCPGNFSKYVNNAGLCVCRPRWTRPRG